MNIGTILAGLQVLGDLMGANQAPQLTPAQAEGEKPKKAQPMQPMVVVLPALPNQTPPMGVGVPPPPPPMRAVDYWSQLPPANVLRLPIWRVPHNAIEMPVFRGVPPTTYFPDFRPDPSLEELYQLYFGTRL